jgi:GntR family transcriptional regulator
MADAPPIRFPLSEQVRRHILAMIRDTGLRPGEKLPTEAELSTRFDVSRTTIREALKLLEQDHVVEAVTGHGRFLTAAGAMRVERPITRYESLTQMLESLGFAVSTSVLDVREDVCREEESERLGLAEGDPVIRLSRLKYGDGKPLVFSVSVIPRALLPGPIEHRDWSASLVGALEAHGHRIVSSSARISAVDLPGEAAEKFRLSGLGPWLLVAESCVSQSGARVLYSEDYHRGSELAFNVLRRR